MNLKALNYFRENHCAGKEFDSCGPCDYAGGPSKTGGGFDCRHPEHPNNWETTLEIQCMYCKVDMGAINGQGVSGVSHSICPKCRVKKFPNTPIPAYEGDA